MLAGLITVAVALTAVIVALLAERHRTEERHQHERDKAATERAHLVNIAFADRPIDVAAMERVVQPKPDTDTPPRSAQPEGL